LAGDPGPAPNDVDVLLIGDVDPADGRAAAARATQRLGIEVNVVHRTENEWATDPTGFAEQVKAGPLIDLTDDGTDHPVETEPPTDGVE
jgi:hypothetical protein